MWIYLTYIFYAHVLLLSTVIIKRTKKPLPLMIGNLFLTTLLIIIPIFYEKTTRFDQWIGISGITFIPFFLLINNQLKFHEKVKRSASLCKRSIFESFYVEGKRRWGLIALFFTQWLLWISVPISSLFFSLGENKILPIWILISVIFIAVLRYAWYSHNRLQRVILLQFPTILTFCYMATASAYPALAHGIDWKLFSALWVGVFGTSMLVSLVYMIKGS